MSCKNVNTKKYLIIIEFLIIKIVHSQKVGCGPQMIHMAWNVLKEHKWKWIYYTIIKFRNDKNNKRIKLIKKENYYI